MQNYKRKITVCLWPLSMIILAISAAALFYYGRIDYAYLTIFILGFDIWLPVLYSLRINKFIDPEGKEVTFQELMRRIARDGKQNNT